MNNWKNNSIQFPRLLAEILAAGLTENQWDDLTESMGLGKDEILQLFHRAENEWELIKSGM